MANNVYVGADNYSWEDGVNWSLGHKPTNTEHAIFSTTVPLAPLAAETVQDLSINGLTLDAGTTLTVLRNVTASGAAVLNILALSGSDGILLIEDSATVVVMTGDVSCAVTITSVNGKVRVNDIESHLNGVVTIQTFDNLDTGTQSAYIGETGIVVIPGTNGSNYSFFIHWEPGSTLHFTGDWAILQGSAEDDDRSPTTINADGNLLLSSTDSDLVLAGTTVNVAGNLVIMRPVGYGSDVNLEGATFIGNNTGKSLAIFGVVTGNYTSSGFGGGYADVINLLGNLLVAVQSKVNRK